MFINRLTLLTMEESDNLYCIPCDEVFYAKTACPLCKGSLMNWDTMRLLLEGKEMVVLDLCSTGLMKE